MIRHDRSAGIAGLLTAIAMTWCGCLAPAVRAQSSDVLPDFPIPGGHFYSQAVSGNPSSGFTITNVDGIKFWDSFLQLGGASALGYPASRRYLADGFVVQATQKELLQWDPARSQSDTVNAFDVMSRLGLDPMLQAKRQIPPPFDNSADAGKTWPQIVARHTAELDWNKAIKARYLADPDPIGHYGLPQSYADEGNVLVVRCQRAVFQQWKEAVPWARAGEVTLANGGDIFKEAGLVPTGAVAPEQAQDDVVAPLGATLALTDDQLSKVHAAASAVLPSVVRVFSDLGNGEAILGSGVILDPSGIILTNAHVVDGAGQYVVTLADGRAFSAGLVGEDTLADIGVLKIRATGLIAVSRGSSMSVQPGSLLLALGYSDYFPAPPAIRVGQSTGILQDSAHAVLVNYIKSNVFILPGDSGGPLVNLQGQMVGIDTAIRFGRGGRTDFTGYSIAFDSVLPLVTQIVMASAGSGQP